MTLVQISSRSQGHDPGSTSEHSDALSLAETSEGALVDRQSRTVEYLRLSLSDRCNLRCTYCRPADGIDHARRSQVLSHEEIVALAGEFARWGVRRLRLTGGEPTMRRGIVELVARLAVLEAKSPSGHLEVVMTTNGELLGELASGLRESGLAAMTISIDSLRGDRYREITRSGDLDRWHRGVEAMRAAGFEGTKLNTVAIDGFNDDELADICAFAWEHGLQPRFIELMPMSGGALFVPGRLLPASEIRRRIAAAHGASIELDDGRGVKGMGPAQYFRLRGGPYDGHRFGTIAAMTENFCAGCNRLRVSATGQLHACLARDEAADLRAALRSNLGTRGAALERAVRRTLGQKQDAHGFELSGAGGPRKHMISIGG
jgi:cyclic pyranopterin phosphate synthase